MSLGRRIINKILFVYPCITLLKWLHNFFQLHKLDRRGRQGQIQNILPHTDVSIHIGQMHKYNCIRAC